MNQLTAWLHRFVPAPINARKRDILFACVGAAIGLMFTEWVSRTMLGNLNPWFIAPMGASAVLLFSVPSSPLAQPWSIVGGNLVAALIGITCARWIPHAALAAGLAGALAIGAMFALRCLHPPSGAVALTAVLGGPAVTAVGYRFAFYPVALNSAFLLLAALVFNNLVRRRYPHAVAHHPNPHRTADMLPSERLGFARTDLDEALKTYNKVLDVNREDLEELFLMAELKAYRRRFGDIRCEDLMSKDVITVQESASPGAVWGLLAKHHIKAAPVVDASGRLAGIVSLHDFIVGHDERLPTAHWLPQLHHAERVADIMTRKVITVGKDKLATELVPLFSDGGFHHLPVVDEKRHVIGMVTQSDLVAALYRGRLEERGTQLRAA
jgi:CBS domain-containing membrane protein